MVLRAREQRQHFSDGGGAQPPPERRPVAAAAAVTGCTAGRPMNTLSCGCPTCTLYKTTTWQYRGVVTWRLALHYRLLPARRLNFRPVTGLAGRPARPGTFRPQPPPWSGRRRASGTLSWSITRTSRHGCRQLRCRSAIESPARYTVCALASEYMSRCSAN